MTAMMIGFIALGVWFGALLFIALGWRFFGFFGDGYDAKKIKKKWLTLPPKIVLYRWREKKGNKKESSGSGKRRLRE